MMGPATFRFDSEGLLTMFRRPAAEERSAAKPSFAITLWFIGGGKVVENQHSPQEP